MTQDDDTSRADDALLLNALVDGELDAASALALERRIATDAVLGADYARLQSLRDILREKSPREVAPQALRARLEAQGLDAPKRKIAAPAAWRNYAAAVAATVAMTLGVEHLVLGRMTSDPNVQSVLAAHMRGQIADQPFDIASSDRHTVKPWLARKLPVSALVVDLSAEGFPLVGARVDIVDGQPAPTLVYKRREHLISLAELPAQLYAASPARKAAQGYPVEVWSDTDRSYVAISDVSAAELHDFVDLLRAAAAKEKAGAPAK
jgi:anti-sigma factor RsiW